jgi:hypothetical protein
VVDACPEIVGISSHGLESVRDRGEQLVRTSGTAVGKEALGELPNSLVGVQFWRVARKADQVEAGNAPGQILDEASGVWRTTVPQEIDVPAQVSEKVLEEGASLLLSDVLEVELEVEVEVPPVRTDGDGGDGRDAITAMHVVEDWRLADGCPGLGHRGRQEEARFVGKDDVGTQPCGVFFTRGQSFLTNLRITPSSRSKARF